MTTKRIRGIWVCAVAASLALANAMAATTDAQTSRVTVDWTDPAQLTEVRQNTCRNSIRPEEWLGELAQHLQKSADKILAAGEHLDVTITDIRRAGACEPWRGPQWDDVRIIKVIYSPRIDLRYALKDGSGNLLREGKATLRDAAFLNRSTLDRHDKLRYEKRLLDDWLRREFGKR